MSCIIRIALKCPLVCEKKFENRLKNEVTNQFFKCTDFVKMFLFL